LVRDGGAKNTGHKASRWRKLGERGNPKVYQTEGIGS